jgi:hypothetical protein
MKPELPEVPSSTGRVVIDFDGTIAEGVWPSPRIGKPMGRGIAILIYYASQGREVIVHTARPESHRERIFAWLRMAGLQDHVYDVVCNKPVADLYIDDKAWNPWKEEVCTCHLWKQGAACEKHGPLPVEQEEGERAVSSGAPSLGSALSKAASPSPSLTGKPDFIAYSAEGQRSPRPETSPVKKTLIDDIYTNMGAVNG